MHQDRTRRGRAQDAPSAPTGAGAAMLAFFRSRAARESAESIVIAFALAFLIRTFEAEAFVIPTGSMAPTLMGRHRDVQCPQCTFKYRVGASQELHRVTEARIGSVFAGTCPMCGYTACINPKYGPVAEENARRNQPQDPVFNSGSGPCQGDDNAWRNGYRILVSKFAYDQREPKRWDVFVFRPPQMADKNYIKRLVGMPGETLRIYRGDLYRGAYNAEALKDPNVVKEYTIERKPPDKVLAMKQLVYDNDYVQASMTDKGWPTRWSAWPRGAETHRDAGAWQSNDGTRTFTTDGTARTNGQPAETWIRYQHYFPSLTDWEKMLDSEKLDARFLDTLRPQLITDTYAYNSSVAWIYPADGAQGRLDYGDRDPSINGTFLGLNWVCDLVLECAIEVMETEPKGAALLELVAGGVPFRCRIDLSDGKATLSMHAAGAKYVFSDAEGRKETSLSAQTPMRTKGTYRLRLANVDHQLHLWVNEQLIPFDMPATFNKLENYIPTKLDLAPAGIGSEGAAFQVSHMRLYRDVYYIAKTHNRAPAMDFMEGQGPLYADENDKRPGPLSQAEILAMRARFFSTPARWRAAFATLNEAAFPLAKRANPREDQFFALGDNSPQSLDGRLWAWTANMKQDHLLKEDHRFMRRDDVDEEDRVDEQGRPSREYYVERELLIGKALLIYWPFNRWGFVR